MRRYMLILLATGAIAALASLAFAGYFTSEGFVIPTSGQASSTLFTYGVQYQMAEDQDDAPNAYVCIYTGSTLWDKKLMGVLDITNKLVTYLYQTTLPAGSNYGFRFETFDDSTILTLGPTVN